MERDTVRSDATFYLIMIVVSAVILFLGFAPSFYLRGVIPAPVPPLSMLTIMHGLVFTSWMLLMIVQASLIRFGSLNHHRQLGMLMAILFGAMVALGISTGITAGRLGHAPPASPPPLAFMALPLIAICSSLILLAGALLYRRHPDVHKRLMLVLAFTLTPPGSGRVAIPLGIPQHSVMFAFLVLEALVAIAILYDLRRYKRVHPAYLFGAGLVIVVHIAVFWAFGSPLWMRFAHFLTQT